MENIRLTNGDETFLLGSVIEDERGPVHAKDCRGSGYTRCDIGCCDHSAVPIGPAWHDDEHTETLWMEMDSLVKCPMCHGEDQYCTLCDGTLAVTLGQANEFRKQNPGAL